MAGKRRHRMTPKRRAALRKAQIASARKRRRRAVGNAVRSVAAVGATAGSMFVAYHTQDLIANPHKAVRYGRSAGRAVRKVQRKPKTVAHQPPKDWSKFGYL